jgi:hypothetical protein
VAFDTAAHGSGLKMPLTILQNAHRSPYGPRSYRRPHFLSVALSLSDPESVAAGEQNMQRVSTQLEVAL